MVEDIVRILERAKGFDWDEANIHKNWELHKVSHVECEEVFFNDLLVVEPDHGHSQAEERYFVLGKTDLERQLFIVFTVRRSLIRVISARDMSKKERRAYR